MNKCIWFGRDAQVLNSDVKENIGHEPICDRLIRCFDDESKQTKRDSVNVLSLLDCVSGWHDTLGTVTAGVALLCHVKLMTHPEDARFLETLFFLEKIRIRAFTVCSSYELTIWIDSGIFISWKSLKHYRCTALIRRRKPTGLHKFNAYTLLSH